MSTLLAFLKALFSLIGQITNLWLLQQAREAGRAEVREAVTQETLEKVQAARGIEREVAATDLDDLAQRMRRFQRD
jgi:hypothetical protein